MNDERLSQLRAVCKSGGKPRVKCEHCDQKYEFTIKTQRRLYCSTACKSAAYRARFRDGMAALLGSGKSGATQKQESNSDV